MIAFTTPCSRDESSGCGVPQRYWDQALHRPVNEFLLRTGKRIRADLVELAYSVCQGRGQVPLQVQGFIELLHAGSLIIDDIQDDSVARRSRPTLHRVIGTPLAINTGNWMYFAAFEKLVELPKGRVSPQVMLKRALSTVRRCHEGQALDLATNVGIIDKKDTVPIARTISKLKTGGLVSLAAWLGAAVAGAPFELRGVFARFGMRLGIALQMQNDLAELRACVIERMPSDDLGNSRVTWPWAWASTLLSHQDFVRLQQIDEIASLSVKLFDCVGILGNEIVKSKLQRAVASLRCELGDNAMRDSRHILDRLENYHV